MKKIKDGDLIFVRPTKWYSWIITKILGTEFSHVAIVYDAEDRLIAETTYDDIVIRRLDKYDEDDYEVYYVKKFEEGNYDLGNLRKAIIKTVGIDYDYIQLTLGFWLRILFNIDIVLNNKNEFICSEMLDNIYIDLGIDIVPEYRTGNITPKDLLHSDKIINR